MTDAGPDAVVVARLGCVPAGMRDLRRAAEAEGFRFVDRLAIEWADGRNRFDRPGEVLFGASLAGGLVGVCGLNRDHYVTDPDLGRIRHLYVLPTARRAGVGRALVSRVIEDAAGKFGRLRLRTSNPDAARLYLTFGFVASRSRTGTHVLDLGGPL